ncbi:MAG: chromate transporter [Bacteroidales bacterium]|nr:chromate transporter [Bacteroidales bacterium]
MKNLTLNLFLSFCKIGAFTFGGGYAMISMVKDCLVDKNKWMTEDDFWDCIALAQALPGVFAINMALYTGLKINGKTGAASAAFGAMLPSFIIIVVIASFFADLNSYESVAKVFAGIRPCVIALIFSPGIAMLKKSKLTIKTLWLPIISLSLICFLGVSPIIVIMVAILLGIISARISYNKIK